MDSRTRESVIDCKSFGTSVDLIPLDIWRSSGDLRVSFNQNKLINLTSLAQWVVRGQCSKSRGIQRHSRELVYFQQDRAAALKTGPSRKMFAAGSGEFESGAKVVVVKRRQGPLDPCRLSPRSNSRGWFYVTFALHLVEPLQVTQIRAQGTSSRAQGYLKLVQYATANSSYTVYSPEDIGDNIIGIFTISPEKYLSALFVTKIKSFLYPFLALLPSLSRDRHPAGASNFDLGENRHVLVSFWLLGLNFLAPSASRFEDDATYRVILSADTSHCRIRCISQDGKDILSDQLHIHGRVEWERCRSEGRPFWYIHFGTAQRVD